MVIATLFFLGLAICIFAGLMCLALARSVREARAHHMPADEMLKWEELKTVMSDLYSRYEVTETPRQKSLRSWAGTLVICAGLCLIGLLIGIDYNTAQTSSLRSVLCGFLESQPAPKIPSAHNQQHDQKSKDKPAAEPTKR